MNTEGTGGRIGQRGVDSDEADGLGDRRRDDGRRLNDGNMPGRAGDDARSRLVIAEVMDGVMASFKGDDDENKDEPKGGQPPA